MAEIMSKGIEAESSSSAWGQLCRRFSIDEIRSATRNFDEGLVVGKGGFGKVYKATLENGGIAAIKRLDRSRSSQGESEFVSEIKTLSKLRHCHLVSLIGYCNDGQEMILVYEFMPNGTLEQHRARLSWLQRLKIGLGAARGLDYLHTGTGTKHGVIHRDVKSSNILLDHNWDAKISDFGLSKIGPTNQTDSFVKTGLKGTFGYIDPCYFSSARLTRRSDVYSFGVVLFELLCGRAAVDKTLNEEQWGLAGWVQKCIKDGKLLQILDSNIRDQISPKCLKAFVGIAGRCLDNDQDKRPTMAEVVVNLVSIVLLQEKMNSSPAKWTLMDKVFSLFPAKNQVISGSKASPELRVSQLTSSKTAEFFQVKDRGDVRTGSIDTRSNSSLRVWNDNFEKRREASEVVIASHLVIESIPKAIGGEQVVAGWNFEKKREVSEVVIASHPVIEEVSEVVVTSHPVIESIPKAIGGEQVVAGWPSWLVAVAGDAIKGWLPRRADSFEKLEKIGQGTRSNVYKARDLISNKIIALKLVRFDDMDPESVKYMAREILVLRRLDHPNVIKLEGLSTSRISCHLYLVFEYMEHDLTGLASLPGIKFTEPQIKCYMQQLLNGLEHCHSRGVLHRDIKSSNLLIDDHGILKIADFGLASFFDRHQSAPLTSRVVTLWYRPPELLLGATQYGVAVDLWSTGCILGELYAGKPIMPGRTEIDQLHKIFKLCGSPSEDFWRKLPNSTLFKPQQPYERRIEETFKDFPSPAIGLMKTLLAIDPAQRGTATFALKSEFFSSTPHACDPSTLPKYPPSKEIDDKIRDERARRQRAAGKDGQRITKESRRSRATRAIPAPSANAELNVNLMRRRRGGTNMMTKSELPVLLLNLQDQESGQARKETI